MSWGGRENVRIVSVATECLFSGDVCMGCRRDSTVVVRSYPECRNKKKI